MAIIKVRSPDQRARLPVRVYVPASQHHFTGFPSGGTANLTQHALVASRLDSPWPGAELALLQMQYAALALGTSDVSIRIPQDRAYREAASDHAGGTLILEEVGGNRLRPARAAARLQRGHDARGKLRDRCCGAAGDACAYVRRRGRCWRRAF